jgi:hypothetical protein
MQNLILRSWSEKLKQFIYFKNGKYYKEKKLITEYGAELFDWKNAEKSFPAWNIILFENDIVQIVSSTEMGQLLDTGIFKITEKGRPVFHLLDDIEDPSIVDFLLYGDNVIYKVIGNTHENQDLIKDD